MAYTGNWLYVGYKIFLGAVFAWGGRFRSISGGLYLLVVFWIALLVPDLG